MVRSVFGEVAVGANTQPRITAAMFPLYMVCIQTFVYKPGIGDILDYIHYPKFGTCILDILNILDIQDLEQKIFDALDILEVKLSLHRGVIHFHFCVSIPKKNLT